MKIKATIAVIAGLLVSANANLIQNGDLEADGYTGTGINNSIVTIANWSGTTKISTTGDNNTIPEAPNTVFRMQDTTSVWQNFYADWGAANTFTVTLNACEVYWRSGGTGNNLLWISLRSAAGSEYEAISIDLQSTHGGSGVTYAEWQPNQTHTVQFSGQDLIDSGATAGEELRLNIYSRDINWVDNISLTGPAAGDPPTVHYGSPFQNGMVLQRGKPIKIWGTDDPSNTVTVSINGNSVECEADANGDWQAELPVMTAGGPHELSASSNGKTNTLSDVLVGDVWIAFGQSNMVRPLSEMINKQPYIDDISTNRMIRCLKINQDAAMTPQSEGGMTWRDNSNPGGWGSVAAVFAHQMHEGSGVPTAVIWAAWGSTSIEGWMPLQMREDFPHFDEKMDDFYANDADEISALIESGWSTTADDVKIRTKPNIVYNQMIHPLLDLGISGFVWYQGEANAGTPENVAQYGFTLPGFIKEYRELFDQGDLPFLGVQLPSYNSTYWAWFREAQGQASALSNAYVAVTIDTGLAGNIHPFDKEPIGQRLALLGRKYALDESIEAHGPIFESMSISGNEATISFSHAAGLTTDDALAPAEFELAGSNQVWYDATSASISGTNVVISSSSVSTPVAVRYAWSPAPVNTVNLVNSDGLPAAPFRSDDWAMPDLGAQAPMAVNDSFSVFSNETLAVAAAGVLENDIDLNRDPLSASMVSDVTYGALALASDGSFTYTADAGFAGYDSFEYAAFDSGLSATATVFIVVQSTLDGGELILNGNFETHDGATGGNTFAGFNDWVGYLDGYSSPDLRNDLGNGDDIIGDSIMIRLATTSTTGDKGFYQDFSTSWDSSSEFTISFNASEAWWKAGGSNNDGVAVSLGDQDGGNAESVYLNLDGTYDAANEPYVTWSSNQTHELTITGAELIGAGVTAGEDLRVDFASTYTGSGNSIVWVDNISVILVPEADAPEFVPGGVAVSNGNLVVSFTGTVGGSYTVESTDDLADTNAWSTATNWSSLPESPMEVALPTTNPATFYRVVTP